MKNLVFSLMLGVGLATAIGAAAGRANSITVDNASGSLKQVGDRLMSTEWVLEDLGGSSVVEDALSTIRFDDAGRVMGSGACNRFNGPYVLDGDQLTIGPLASTRRACESAISIQESRYLQAIEATERAEVSAPFLFLYTTQFDRPLRFIPLTANSEAITTVVAFQGRENAVRVFVQGGRTRMNVFNKADQTTWIRGVPVTVEHSSTGLRFVNQTGESTVVVTVPTSGDPMLAIDGELDQ
jgi:heat shock protein HslJ